LSRGLRGAQLSGGRRWGRFSGGVLAALSAAPRLLIPLALLASALALIAPSPALARASDLLLAGLVFAVALGIPLRELAQLRAHALAVAVLALAPLPVLAALGWALGRPFGAPVRDGLLSVGLASSEVASVGLVALAGADAALALGVLAGSLVAAALLGPIGLALLGSAVRGVASVGASAETLLARFALVVLAPLAGGLLARAALSAAGRLRSADRARKRMTAPDGRSSCLPLSLERGDGGTMADSGQSPCPFVRLDPAREGVAALLVAILLYAALSGIGGLGGRLGETALGAALFLLASGALALLWARLARHRPTALPGAFAIAMRDFAVAAALATQAYGPRAGALPGVYGVLMLLAGSGAAGVLRTCRIGVARREGWGMA
jgi:predicted Na+-dependent transporter